MINNIISSFDCFKSKVVLDDKIKIHCPYCNDNTLNGNLYLNNLKYKCFYCNIEKDLLVFYNENNINYSIPEKNNIIEYLNSIYPYRITVKLLEELHNLSLHKEVVLYDLKLSNITEDTFRSYAFLKSKFLSDKLELFKYDEKNKHIYLFNYDKNNENIISYVIFNLINYGKIEKFVTLKDIYKRLDLDYTLINDSVDKLSNMYNILKLDFEREITIFDDLLNSLHYKNSIFINYSKDILNENNIRFFYANNIHGNKRSIEANNNGFKTFDWRYFFKDNNIKNKIYTLVDIVKLSKIKNINYELDKYFT